MDFLDQLKVGGEAIWQLEKQSNLQDQVDLAHSLGDDVTKNLSSVIKSNMVCIYQRYQSNQVRTQG
jgi:hypothetical protein